MNASMPSLSKPIELSSPAAVSTVRHGGLPTRGSAVIVLGMTAPSLPRSTRCCISRAYPNVPLATRIGLASSSRPSRTRRSTSELLADRFVIGLRSLSHPAIRSAEVIGRPV